MVRSLTAVRSATLVVVSLAASVCGGLTEPTGDALAGPWLAVSVGGAHACAISDGGALSCWGANDRGQAGTDDGTDWIDAPRRVSSGGAGSFVQVSAGERHTCAIDVGGAVWCWGANDLGQLGDGTFIDRRAPVRVRVSGAFDRVSAGAEHTCALTHGGAGVCWGTNLHGELGSGAATPDPLPPVSVVSAAPLTGISAGRTHTCAVGTAAAAYCWGANGNGSLGTGSLVDSPRPSTVAGGHVFEQIAVGPTHSCGLDLAGSGWCWGSNALGQVADDATEVVGTPLSRGEHPWVSLGVGEDWTCGLAATGRVTCFGVRWDTLENGEHPVDRAGWEPIALAGHVARLLSVGPREACAVLETGALACWGGGGGLTS